jgi:dTDP-4-dehydrorhamnose reductase
MRWAVIGKSGQVGRRLIENLDPSEGRALGHQDLDLAETTQLRGRLERHLDAHRPELVFLPAAYTAVDQAEREVDLCHRVNGEAPGIVAEYCKSREALLVHYSTDYVFNGSGERPWRESDSTDPLNVYGRSKLEGEKAVERAGGRHLIFRTSWVYDSVGKNFVLTMLRLAGEKKALKIVCDQHGTPNAATELARASIRAGQAALRYPSLCGLYHLSASGFTNWFEFAKKIFELRGISPEMQPVSSAEFPTPAKRPANSRLDTSLFASRFGFELKPWPQALAEVLHSS